jgi:phosphoribosylformylglycinamidine cyclo-ligase
MYQVFNMGHRLEIFTDAVTAEKMIQDAAELGIDARIVGRVEASDKKELLIQTGSAELIYEY